MSENGVASNGARFKSIKPGFVERSYLRYTLWTGIYMLDSTEARIANCVLLTIGLFSCRCLYYAVAQALALLGPAS